MSRKKKKTKSQSLRISIHGKGLDIEAKIGGDSDLGEVLADAVRRLRGGSAQSQEPLADLIVEFGKTLRKDQLETLMNTLDMSQKVLFMEIMQQTQPADESRAS